jgi:hypothetical protein
VEPVNACAVDESWELATPVTELWSDRREAKNDMQTVANTFQEKFPDNYNEEK